MSKKPVVLAILDGFGVSFDKRGNAVYLANTPNLRAISREYPGTTLRASGIEVGLSWGEMGSSEVGHTNIGAGLVVYQNLERFNIAIRNKSFYSLDVWKRVAAHAETNGGNIHLMGLLSNGGVHSHIEHLFAILRALREIRFKGRVFIHIITDGQDTAPQSAPRFLESLEDEMAAFKIGEIASVSGRYFAMDRNENWDRIEKFYRCLTEGVGGEAMTPQEAIALSYDKNATDESIEPTIMVDEGGEPIGLIQGNDSFIFFTFGADRARQITRAFTDPEFNKFPRVALGNLLFASLTQYGLGYQILSAFPPEYISTPLAKVISDAGKSQLHIAEREKYAHVTYFFNGGIEKEFLNEDRIIVPSKSAASYDAIPEMSAREIADRVVADISAVKYDFIVVNFANGDIVGHTGNLPASIRAVEVLDECVGKLRDAVFAAGGILVITADHGNVEELINLETGEIDKEHSTNPVPFWIVSEDRRKPPSEGSQIGVAPQGILADVAPTILELMGISKPEGMTGTSLLGIITECPLP